MDIYFINVRWTHVDLLRMVFLMLYLFIELEITFIIELHFFLIQWLLPYKKWKYTYFFSKTLSPPKNLCAEGCKGSGRESLRYNLRVAKGKEREEGEWGTKGEGGGPGCDLAPRHGFRKHEPLPRSSSWSSAWNPQWGPQESSRSWIFKCRSLESKLASCPPHPAHPAPPQPIPLVPGRVQGFAVCSWWIFWHWKRTPAFLDSWYQPDPFWNSCVDHLPLPLSYWTPNN